MKPATSDSTTTEPHARMGFWDFCHKHPIALVFIALFTLWGIGSAISDVAFAVTGNYPQPSANDEFWKYNGSCK